MEPFDRDGIPISEYPMTHQGAELLGINGDGIAEYFRPSGTVSLVEFSEGKELRAPSEFGPAHELTLDSFGWSLQDYLEASIEERGEWRVYTTLARNALDGEFTEAGTKPFPPE